MFKSLIAKRTIHTHRHISSRTVMTGTCQDVIFTNGQASITANQEYCFNSTGFMFYPARNLKIAYSRNNGINFSEYTENAFGATALPYDEEENEGAGAFLYKIKSNESQSLNFYETPFVSYYAFTPENNLTTNKKVYLSLKNDFEVTLSDCIDYKYGGFSTHNSTELIFFNPNSLNLTYRNNVNSKTLLDDDPFTNNTAAYFGILSVFMTNSYYNSTIASNVSGVYKISSVVTGTGNNGTFTLPELLFELTNETIYTYSIPDATITDFTADSTTSGSSDSEPVLKTWHIILIAVGGVVVVAAIAIIIYCLACRKKGVQGE